jgi:RNA polymerase sigma-70 factor (ECF subfamily)
MEETMDTQSGYSLRMAIPFTSDGDSGQCVAHTASSKEQHLVLAARSGCRIAFNELWDLYSRRVYRTLLGITNNPQDAEDALQDAFLRAFLALNSFEGRANFYTWLTRIAINSALGTLRKRRCRPETSLGANSQHEDDGPQDGFKDLTPGPEQIYARQEEREKLMQAIQRLPRDLRKAIQARVTENCSVKEVACRLNISEAAAKSRLYRASIMLGSLTTARGEAKAQIKFS